MKCRYESQSSKPMGIVVNLGYPDDHHAFHYLLGFHFRVTTPSLPIGISLVYAKPL